KGEHLWDYLYIEDAVDAIMTVMKHEASGIYNVACGSAQPLKETVIMIRDQVNTELSIGFGEAGHGAAATPLQASVERLRGLGWRPATPLIVGLQKTVSWNRSRYMNPPV
ncbi:MAG: NAD-dependent epimerase/dehydratase family protein, partial [Proteobacteria bacterium]|nr:NAD-dependent epimerase/dehydratase family protein [Pseudomonadota bacterium]